MHIEVGKTYQTRDGRKAVVLAKNPFGGSWNYVGVIEDDAVPCAWTFVGTFGKQGLHSCDLIAEWDLFQPLTRQDTLELANHVMAAVDAVPAVLYLPPGEIGEKQKKQWKKVNQLLKSACAILAKSNLLDPDFGQSVLVD